MASCCGFDRALVLLYHFTNVFRLEVCVDELRGWLRQMEESLQKEVALCGASQPGVPDFSIQLKRVEEIHKELLARRFVLMFTIS